VKNDQKNRAILLTPPGAAAIAVVRMAGAGVREFFANHFSREVKPGRCIHGTLSDDAGNVIDDPVVVFDPADESIADVNVHGGAWVVQSVLNLAREYGFEAVEANDAPQIAFDAASELDREVLQYLPQAKTELALRTLLAQPEAWRALIPELVESMLADRSLEHLLNPPAVAIVGAPNVGKSTLANQLFAQERSITADVPGTTRDWVGEIANVDGLAVMLIDTPGVRETHDEIESRAIAASRVEVERAQLVVLVLDASRPLDPEQTPLMQAHPEALRVMNKSDLPRAWDVAVLGGIQTVASTGEGVCALRDAIRRHFGCMDIDSPMPHVWTARQRQLLEGYARSKAPAGPSRDVD
jgi:tRNA modification GTPase